MTGQRLEVMKYLEGFVEEKMPSLIKAEDDYWQPADMLPKMSDPEAFDEIRELQAKARELPDEVMVVLIGDMITEEALPSYSAWISQVRGFDVTGNPRNPWGSWLRKWTAEENRHGDTLNRYLYLSGRVNMREVEVTVQNLLSDGGDVGVSNDPYRAFAYTSFQEIATNVSHRNVALLARKAGDDILHRLCSFVAGDEARHARAYKLFFQKCLEADTSDALLAFYDMMRSKVTMPAMYMRERGKSIGETFRKFSDVAERTGVYTKEHYSEILDTLVAYWDIGNLTNLTPEAAKAQEYLCTLSDRYRKVAARFNERQGKEAPEVHRFAWLELPGEALISG